MSGYESNAKKITKSDFVGVGAFVQLIGIIMMFFWFPLGLIAGFIALLIGSRMALYKICSQCGNKLQNKESKVCPTCRASFN